MARTKTEVLTIRTTEEIKTLLKAAADREHRSLTSMLEVLVMDHAERTGVPSSPPAAKTGKARRWVDQPSEN